MKALCREMLPVHWRDWISARRMWAGYDVIWKVFIL